MWRYDPIVLTSAMDAAAHRRGFAALAAALAGTVDEVVLSFANPYRKTRRNLDRAAERHGFAWHDPPAEEKRALLACLGRDRRRCRHGRDPVHASPICWSRASARRAASMPGACPTSRARPVAARESGNRPGCRCALSRDIGAYDTCPHGCVYCYAVAERDRAVARHKAHDPRAESLRRLTRRARGNDSR